MSPTEEQEVPYLQTHLQAAANVVGSTVKEVLKVAKEAPVALPTHGFPKTKTCSHPNCGEEKDLETGFHDSPGTVDGKHSHCKECRNKHISRYRDGKKKIIRLYLKKYPDIYDQIADLAFKRVRSLEEQIISILKDYIEEKG